MALKKCVQCGWEVSTEAANCPGCGAPVSAPATRINWEPCPRCASGRVRHLARGGRFIVGVGLIFLGVVLLVLPPLGVVVIIAGWFLIAKANNRACLDCLYSWRYPSKAAQKSSRAHSAQGPVPHSKVSSRLIVGGVLIVFALVILLAGVGFVLEKQGKAELARADKLWVEGKQAEAIGIYVGEMLYVDDANKPEVFNRIITQLYDSGDKEGATNYYNKAIEEGLHIEFAHSDLRRFFDKSQEVIDTPKNAELTVEAENSELSDGAESGQFKLEQAPLAEGMTYSEVCGVIGWEGTERGYLAGPDDSKTTAYKWEDEEGSLVASFRDNALDKWDYSKRKIQVLAEAGNVEATKQFYETVKSVGYHGVIADLYSHKDGPPWQLTITVNAGWDALPQSTRTEYARTFRGAWAGVCPVEPGGARIWFDIVNLAGKKVGGGSTSQESYWAD